MGRFSHVFRLKSSQNSGLDVLEKVLLLTLNHRVGGSIPSQPTALAWRERCLITGFLICAANFLRLTRDGFKANLSYLTDPAVSPWM